MSITIKYLKLIVAKKTHKTKFSIGMLQDINPALKYVTHNIKKILTWLVCEWSASLPLYKLH